MPQLRFEGYSDDTFGEYGYTKQDFCCNGTGKMIAFCLTLGSEGMHVTGQYDSRDWHPEMPGCWVIGLQQLKEGVPLPNWPMRFEQGDSDYTLRLVIDVPAGTEVKLLNERDEGL